MGPWRVWPLRHSKKTDYLKPGAGSHKADGHSGLEGLSESTVHILRHTQPKAHTEQPEWASGAITELSDVK